MPGIGIGTEQQIWESGVLNWAEFIEKHHKLPISSKRKEIINEYSKMSIDAYDNKDYSFFFNKIPMNLHWRAYDELKNKCCFLDIETTGLSKHYNDITVIGLYDGKESKLFVNGKNLDDFTNEIKKYPMIVSFNGRCFDIPFIQAKFPNLDLSRFHIDLRFAMKDIGYTGGLKRIENRIGIERDDELKEVDGFEAVRLWRKYKKGDKSALDLLLKYNQADIENLKGLMDFAFDRLKEKNHPLKRV